MIDATETVRGGFPAGADRPTAVPWLFQGLPEMPAAGVRLAAQVTAAWRGLLADGDLYRLMVELGEQYLKVSVPQPMELTLRREGERRTVAVDRSPFRVGRRPDSDLVIGDQGVSGLHAQLQCSGERWELIDPGSVNGTLLNGVRLERKEPVRLSRGDVITIMKTELLVGLPDPLIRPPRLTFELAAVQAGSPPETDPRTQTAIRFGLPGGNAPLTLLAPTSLLRSLTESLVGIRYYDGDLDLPLGDVEQGLLEFLLLKFLQRVHVDLLPDRGDPFCLAGIDSPAPALAGPEGQVCVRLLVRFEDRRGEFLLWLPDPSDPGLAALRPPALSECPAALASLLAPWNWIEFDVPVVVAAVGLSPVELGSLEHGDVILFADCAARLDDEGYLSGEVGLHFAGGRRYRGVAVLERGAEGYELTFREYRQTTIARKDMEDKPSGAPPTESAAPPAGLVRELDLTLVVELDRLQLSLEQLMNLVPGQVLQLNRLPTEPVALTVSGRAVGQGQLVKIKNELGVKILSMQR